MSADTTASHHPQRSLKKKLTNNSVHLQDIVYTVIGVLFASFALRSFLVPHKFLDGGVTGISLLLHELYHWNIGVLILLLNIPFIIIGGYLINRAFAIKTLGAVILLALSLLFIPFPEYKFDNLILVSIFGGFFLGLGIGLGMRGGCAIDGIEVLALYTLRRVGLTMSEVILGINTIIFLVAALQFGLEVALYAMLTYYIATRTIDYVVEGIEEYTGVTIISAHSEVIKEKLAKEMGRGITIYKGERGYLKDSYHVKHDVDIVFTVITRLEVRRLKTVVYLLDPKAFVFTHTIREAAGGVLKRHVTH
jgi:uncharacterized membrane-anchored protein YitT (DUF2179 family)